MIYAKFIIAIEAVYGRSWQAQLADYLLISRKTVGNWVERKSLPEKFDQEIEALVLRNTVNAEFAVNSLKLSDDDFYHARAIHCGEVFHYDCEKYNFEDIKQFIQNQKWRTLQEAKRLIAQNDSDDEIENYIDADFLSVNDIAEHLEKNHVADNDIEEIQNMRSDACFEVKDIVDSIYQRNKK